MVNGTLVQFKTMREHWIKCLERNDRNSIKRQIRRMVWNTAAYQVINEARRIAPPDKDGGVQLNGLMHRLINDGFVEGQMLAIRRLTDKFPIKDRPCNRDVISLTSPLDDMEKHAHLMTRENMFAAEELEYDVDHIRAQADEYAQKKIMEGERTWFVPVELDWQHLDERHKQIDSLAGVTSANRSRQDAIRREVMQQLKAKVVIASKDLRVYVDKFVAHAASPESRQEVRADRIRITLNNLFVAHEALCKVANFVGLYLLTGNSRPPLPIPQYNQFAYMDRPLVTKDGLTTLEKAWNDFENETHGWCNWGMDEFRQEFLARDTGQTSVEVI